MAKFCKLSEEMYVQILRRLPPKALMRFKCVCKSLYNLINNPSFVAKNLSNSLNNKLASSTYILFKRTVLKDSNITDKEEIADILRDGTNDKKEILLSLLNCCDHNYSEDQNLSSVVEDLIVPFPIGIYPFSLKIAGHCDGIICLTSYEHVVLCNPAIKEFKFLPRSCLLLPPKHPDDYDNEDDYHDALESNPTAVGFGYDSKAKDYKIVRIVEFSSGYVFTSHPSRAEVYTLSANSWREINIGYKSFVFWAPAFEIYFKGFFYWNALSYPTPGEEKDIILSFDMTAEIFHDISIPESISMKEGFLTSLAVWKESIVLISYGDDNPKSLEIWVMDDSDGFKNLWTKQLSIGPVEGEIPLIFWKSNEILMVTVDGRVVSYNLGTQMLKYLPIYGVEDHEYIQAVVYVNSIISVKGDNKLEGIS